MADVRVQTVALGTGGAAISQRTCSCPLPDPVDLRPRVVADPPTIVVVPNGGPCG